MTHRLRLRIRILVRTMIPSSQNSRALPGQEGSYGGGRGAERQLIQQGVVDLGLVFEALPPDLGHLVPVG